jgi:hypothetical protein
MLQQWWYHFRKYFLPHESNEHQPHFLREWSIVSLLMLIILVEGVAITISFFILPRSTALIGSLPEASLEVLNQSRARAGLPALVIDEALQAEATRRAKLLASSSVLGDTKYGAKAEYQAINFFDAEDLVETWDKLSPGITQSDSKLIGIGIAPGRYQDRAALYAVALVGGESASVLERHQPSRFNQTLDAAVGVTRLGFWTRMATSLHGLASKIYVVLLAIIALAVLLNIVIDIRIQHLPTIVNGLLVIILLSGLLYINNYLFVERIQASYLAFVV